MNYRFFFLAVLFIIISCKKSIEKKDLTPCRTTDCNTSAQQNDTDTKIKDDTLKDDSKTIITNDDTYPDEFNESQPIIEYIKTFSLHQTWETLPYQVKKKLQRHAEEYIKYYHERWNYSSLTQMITDFDQNTTEQKALYQSFLDSHFSKVQGIDLNGIVINANLQKTLKKLLVLRIAAWQLFLPLQNDTLPYYHDGKTKISTIPLSQREIISDHQKFAKEIMKELSSISDDTLNETERMIKNRAMIYTEQHITGSTGLMIGGNDLLTISGYIKNIDRIIFSYNTKGKEYFDKTHESHEHMHYHDDEHSHSVQYFLDDNNFLEQVNAFYFGNIIQASNGQKHALKYFMETQFPTSDIIEHIGNPNDNDTAKAFVLLTKWFAERIQDDATTDTCISFSQTEKEIMWKSFSADLMLHDEFSSQTLTKLQKNFDDFSYMAIEKYKQAIYDAFQIFSQSTSLTKEQKEKVISDMSSETRYGKVVEAFYSSLDQQTSGLYLSNEFVKKLVQLPMIGGYNNTDEPVHKEDEENIQIIWQDIYQYLQNLLLPQDIQSLLPDVVTVKNQEESIIENNSIIIGVFNKNYALAYYSKLFQIASAYIRMKKNIAYSEVFWDTGAHLYLERILYYDAIKNMVDDTSIVTPKLLPYFLIASLSLENFYFATTNATFKTLLLDKCTSRDFDTFEYARQITFHNWGMEIWEIDDSSYLSHFGTEFLYNFASEVAVREILDYLQMQLSPYKIDPFIINACGIAVPRKDYQTIQKLTACLK